MVRSVVSKAAKRIKRQDIRQLTSYNIYKIVVNILALIGGVHMYALDSNRAT